MANSKESSSKKHHSRRKSGHGYYSTKATASANSSVTDVRGVGGSGRAALPVEPSTPAASSTRHKRPSTLTRRTTPVSAHKLGKSPREREREWREALQDDDERESFPQYCMTCEKEFVPFDHTHLYCSEGCREHDEKASRSGSRSQSSGSGHSASADLYPHYSTGSPEPRDIIPRASPSRPSSMFISSPPVTPGSQQSHYQHQHQGSHSRHHHGASSKSHPNPKTLHHHQQHHSSALSALRSLNQSMMQQQQQQQQQPSPPSPSHGSSMWPFSRSSAASPSTSYTRSGFVPATYDAAAGYFDSGYGTSSAAMDRPLPARRSTAYARPKSIELVTPMVGR